jgi:glycosyl transferase family 2
MPNLYYRWMHPLQDPVDPSTDVTGSAAPPLESPARPRSFGRRKHQVDRLVSAYLGGRSSDSRIVVLGPSAIVNTRSFPGGVQICSLEQLATDDNDLPSPASACLLDGVLHVAPDPGAVLRSAYGRLAAGGRLAITVPSGRPGPPLRSQQWTPATLPFPADSLQCLLFREGFVGIHQKRVRGYNIVMAERSWDAPPASRALRLSVIVPVYNERATFKKTMELVLSKEIPGIDLEVIIVESNSTDGTRDDAIDYSRSGVNVLLQDRPQGKGHAVRTGLAAATGDFVLIQDADLEYDIDDYDALLEPLMNFKTSFVMGKRKAYHDSWGLRRFGDARLTSHFMNVGHIFFMLLFNVTYRQRLHDPFTMYKVFRRDCLTGLTLQCNRFDFDWELLAKLVRSGYSPIEIPVHYRSRSFQEGKKVSLVKDPITWVLACFRFRFARL